MAKNYIQKSGAAFDPSLPDVPDQSSVATTPGQDLTTATSQRESQDEETKEEQPSAAKPASDQGPLLKKL